jgi:hypothetical protein
MVDDLGPAADVNLTGTMDNSDFTVTFDAEITTKRDGKPITTIDASGSLDNWGGVPADQLLTKMTGNVDANLRNVPATLIEQLTDQRGKIAPNVGPAVDADARLILPEPGKGQRRIEVTLAGRNLRMPEGPAVLTLGQTLKLEKPFVIEFDATPPGYAALARDAPPDSALAQLELREPTRASIAVDALDYMLPETATDAPRSFLAGLNALDADVKLTRSVVRQKREAGEPVDMVFETLVGSIQTDDRLKTVKLVLTGTPIIDRRPGKPQRITVDLGRVLDPAGRISAENLNALVNLTAVSVRMIDAFAGATGKIEAALGKVTDGQIKYNQLNNGELIASLDAEHAKFRMQGRIGKDGLFRLTKTLVAEFQVTEQFGSQLLQSINPILETAYTADQPIRFVIPYDPDRPDDLIIPTTGMDLRKVVVKKAVLELGKLKMKPGGVLNKLNGFLKRDKNSDSTIWFTPLVVSMEDGKARYTRRLDLLLDGSYHLVTWGQVQFADKQQQAAGRPLMSEYQMTLGVHASTLRNVFGLKNVPDDSMFVIPMRGTTTDKKIEFAKAAGSLAKLIAEDQGLTRLMTELRNASPIAAALLKKPIEDARKKLNKALGGDAPPPSVDEMPWAEQQARRDARRDAEQQPQPQPQQPDAQPTPNDESPERRLLRDLLD